MSLSRNVLAGSAAYLLVGLLLAGGVLPPLTAAMLAALYALLVPAGFGLIFCFGWRGSISPGIGRVQALLVAWLFGTLAIIYVFVLLDRWGLTAKLADSAIGALLLLGAAGCMRMHGAFMPQRTDWLTLRLVVMVALPLVIVQYVAEIPLYSDYPVLDLFQRTHFHKGALEFANFDLLNPFVADSYPPFQQLLLGLMARGAHIDPLLAEWVLPIVMALLKVCAIFAVVSRLTTSRTQLGLAIGLFLAMSRVMNPTNGDLASLGALLLMSFLLGQAEEGKASHEIMTDALFLFAAIAASLVLIRVSADASAVVLLSTGLLASVPALSAKATRALVIAIVIFAAFSFHRAAMLFVVLVVAIKFAWTFLSLMHRRRYFRSLAVFSLVLVLLVGGMAGWTLVHDGQRPKDEFGLWAIFDFILIPLAGKSMAFVTMDLDLVQGSGGRISLFEVARSLTFVGALVGGLLFLRVIVPAIGEHDAKVGDTSLGGQGIPLMMVCLLLLCVALTGFPFVHRSAFLIATLLSVVLALFVYPSGTNSLSSARAGIFGSIGLVGYMGSVLALLLVVHDTKIAPFLERVFPLLFLLLVAGVAIAASCIRSKRAMGLGPVLVVAVLFEVVASRAYFKQYAFMSQTHPQGAVFSHFGMRELVTVDSVVAQLAPGAVLVSDTKTMALMGARSGLNSIVSFSNVNTITEERRRELARLLGKVVAGAPVSELCSELLSISNLSASGSLNYARLRLIGMPGREVLDLLGYNTALVARSVAPPRPTGATGATGAPADSTSNSVSLFVIVISPDTLDWLDHPSDPSYFPARRDVSEIADIIWSYGAMGRLVGDAFVLSLRCN